MIDAVSHGFFDGVDLNGEQPIGQYSGFDFAGVTDEHRQDAVLPADEVRKLAEGTRKATSEIEQLMQDMKGSKDEMLASIEQTVQNAHVGVERAREAESSIDTITGKVARVGDVVADISSALHEQNSAAQNIAVHVETIARMAESSSGAVSSIATEVATLNKVAASLGDAVARFRLGSA